MPVPFQLLNGITLAKWLFINSSISLNTLWRWIKLDPQGLEHSEYNTVSGRHLQLCRFCIRAEYRFAPNQWETALLCNDVSHWPGTSLESALCIHDEEIVQGLFKHLKCSQYLVTHFEFGRSTHHCEMESLIGSKNWKRTSNFSVKNVHANGPIPWGTRAFASTAVT